MPDFHYARIEQWPTNRFAEAGERDAALDNGSQQALTLFCTFVHFAITNVQWGPC